MITAWRLHQQGNTHHRCYMRIGNAMKQETISLRDRRNWVCRTTRSTREVDVKEKWLNFDFFTLLSHFTQEIMQFLGERFVWCLCMRILICITVTNINISAFISITIDLIYVYHNHGCRLSDWHYWDVKMSTWTCDWAKYNDLYIKCRDGITRLRESAANFRLSSVAQNSLVLTFP